MNIKKLICGVILILLLLISSVGCGTSSSRDKEPIQLVPQSANFVAQIELGKLLNDQDLINAYNQNRQGVESPETAQQGLDRFAQETGLNLKDFSQILVFGDTAKMQESDSGSNYLGFIGKGNFDDNQFIQKIESKTGKQLDSVDYNNFTLYTSRDDQYTITFVGNSTFIIGTMPAVKDTIDVQIGTQKSLSGPIIETYNSLGNALIKASFSVSAGNQNELKQGISKEIPFSLEMFSKVDQVGFAFDKISENMSFKINMHFPDSASVQDGKDTIVGAISLFKGLIKEIDVKNLLSKVQITSSDLWLDISLTATITDLQKMADTFPKK
jgi:hypothetical protein